MKCALGDCNIGAILVCHTIWPTGDLPVHTVHSTNAAHLLFLCAQCFGAAIHFSVAMIIKVTFQDIEGYFIMSDGIMLFSLQMTTVLHVFAWTELN